MKNHNLNGFFYLNNSGSRWVIYESGKLKRIEFTTESGRKVTRAALYFEAFGNFATCTISYKGKRISVFPDQILKD